MVIKNLQNSRESCLRMINDTTGSASQLRKASCKEYLKEIEEAIEILSHQKEAEDHHEKTEQ